MPFARRRPLKRWTAADWPFYRPGVNPVASDTPADVERTAAVYLARKEVGHPDTGLSYRALETLLSGDHRNRWHRVGDTLVGLWDAFSGQSEIRTTRAFSILYRRRYQ